MLSAKYTHLGNVFRLLLCAGLFILAAILPLGLPLPNTVMAVGCTGSECTGLNPETMGCGSSSLTGPSFSSDSVVVENRYNITCNAEWARTTNNSGSNRYAAATIRYGGIHYNYGTQDVSSPAVIANGQRVYTPMIGPDSTIDSLSCGSVSSTGQLGRRYGHPAQLWAKGKLDLYFDNKETQMKIKKRQPGFGRWIVVTLVSAAFMMMLGLVVRHW
jgi:uncharacterized protein DUF2690